MNEEILNKVYSASLEFGENFHKPIIDIVAELYPYIPDDEKTAIADYVGQTRDAIEQYFYDKYDYKNEKANKELQHQGKQWIENKYCWMNSENVNRAVAQGMYYAWHG